MVRSSLTICHLVKPYNLATESTSTGYHLSDLDHLISGVLWFPHPRRYVAFAMEDAPDIDVIVALHIEDQIWISP